MARVRRRADPGAVATCLLEIAVTGDDGPATAAAPVVALTAVPAAIGIAVMRYRLYEIDRLINRTLVYVALSAALAAVFAAVSLGVGVAVGSGSTLATAAATLAVALLFGPLRARVQLLVDRRFDRARYEGLRTVEHFLEDLRAGTRGARGDRRHARRGARRSRARAALPPRRRGRGRRHGPRGRGPDPPRGCARRCAAAASRWRRWSTMRRSASGPTCWRA